MSPAIKCLILLAVVALFFVTEMEITADDGKNYNTEVILCQDVHYAIRYED